MFLLPIHHSTVVIHTYLSLTSSLCCCIRDYVNLDCVELEAPCVVRNQKIFSRVNWTKWRWTQYVHGRDFNSIHHQVHKYSFWHRFVRTNYRWIFI